MLQSRLPGYSGTVVHFVARAQNSNLEYYTTSWATLTCSAYLLKQTTTIQIHDNGYNRRSTSYLPVTVHGEQASKHNTPAVRDFGACLHLPKLSLISCSEAFSKFN